jgi:hypothetical protein
MTGIVDDIDRAITGVCPCGAGPRPGSIYCCDDCVPTHRGEDTTSDRDGTAMRMNAGHHRLVAHRRLCVHCGERTQPRRGRRVWPARVDDVEECDLCGGCGRSFPGPPLTVTVFEVGQVDAYGWTMRLAEISGTRFLAADDAEDVAAGPAGQVRWALDRLEVRVLRQFVRRHPGRPDAAEWLAAHEAREWRLRQVRVHQIYARQLASSLVDPRDVFRGFTDG